MEERQETKVNVSCVFQWWGGVDVARGKIRLFLHISLFLQSNRLRVDHVL